MVPAGSTGEDLMKELAKQYPNLKWSTNRDADVEELLKQVADGKVDYTVVQDTILARTQRYYPELTEGLTLASKQTVAWAMTKLPDDSLYASIIDFFGQRFMDGAIAKLDEKYFGHVQNFDFVDTRTFLQRAKSLLPKYQALFQTHAKDIDWRLLAAISYQESHWDPQARSYTGVRGMMMLTGPTAKAMGVNDRTHPEESIKGGARYLQEMMAKVPDSVPADEKVWFALTAYNIGYGHMMDARRLTKELGKNPDAWSDVKEVLPLLQQSRWHRKVRYGYARGGEARNYVNNVRQYYQSLLWLDNEQQKAHRREELDEDDSSEPDVPAQRPAIIAEVVKQIITPSLAGGVFSCSVLCYHPWVYEGRWSELIAMYSLRCSSCPGPFRPPQDQGGEQDASTQKSHVGPKNQMCLEPETQAQAGRHETQDLARNRSFTLLIAEHTV